MCVVNQERDSLSLSISVPPSLPFHLPPTRPHLFLLLPIILSPPLLDLLCMLREHCLPSQFIELFLSQAHP